MGHLGEDAVGPLEGLQVVLAVQVGVGHRLGVDHHVLDRLEVVAVGLLLALLLEATHRLDQHLPRGEG